MPASVSVPSPLALKQKHHCAPREYVSETMSTDLKGQKVKTLNEVGFEPTPEDCRNEFLKTAP